MKAVRVHAYHSDPTIDEIPEPTLQGPLDVIVKIGGAGVCRTDLHIINGDWEAAQHPDLPYVIGHENAGWVHAVGEGVTNVKVGDTVILHPQPSCGMCLACRAGRDMQCDSAFFPGLSNNDGGMAEYLRTTARACVKLDPSTDPADVAALADAGITAYHAVRKAASGLFPGTTAVVQGAGGLGHIGVQTLKAITSAKVIVVDRNPAALELAKEIGADETVVSDGSHIDGTPEFVNLMDQLLSMQEGGLRVEAPAIELSTAELIQQSALPADMLAWAHSCHKANTPCWNCRGCNKYRETYDEVSASMA